MSINRFYTEILGASSRNPQWSWGSLDPVTNRVYLHVWKDELVPVDGKESILVLRSTPRRKSPGYPERKRHLDMIRSGAEGFGVLCTAHDSHTEGARKIKSFDSEFLLELGDIVERPDGCYARVEGRIAVSDLRRRQSAGTTLAGDLKNILRRPVDATERETLVSARIGQGPFRAQVLRLWGGRCAVTGVAAVDVIRASHIKAWKDSTDDERLDPYNGLPLAAHLDALFDAGLITINQTGEVTSSGRLSASDRLALSVDGARLSRPVDPATEKYLQYHRENVYRFDQYQIASNR